MVNWFPELNGHPSTGPNFNPVPVGTAAGIYVYVCVGSFRKVRYLQSLTIKTSYDLRIVKKSLKFEAETQKHDGLKQKPRGWRISLQGSGQKSLCFPYLLCTVWSSGLEPSSALQILQAPPFQFNSVLFTLPNFTTQFSHWVYSGSWTKAESH